MADEPTLRELIEGLESALGVDADESLSPEGRLAVCERKAAEREYEAKREGASDADVCGAVESGAGGGADDSGAAADSAGGESGAGEDGVTADGGDGG